MAATKTIMNNFSKNIPNLIHKQANLASKTTICKAALDKLENSPNYQASNNDVGISNFLVSPEAKLAKKRLRMVKLKQSVT